MGRKVQPVCDLSVRVVPELVVNAARPLELTECEEQRHKRVLEDRARDTVLPVAPIGDEDLLFYNAEAPAPREAPYKLYVVELEPRVEPLILPEEVARMARHMPAPDGRMPWNALVTKLNPP